MSNQPRGRRRRDFSSKDGALPLLNLTRRMYTLRVLAAGLYLSTTRNPAFDVNVIRFVAAGSSHSPRPGGAA